MFNVLALLGLFTLIQTLGVWKSDSKGIDVNLRVASVGKDHTFRQDSIRTIVAGDGEGSEGRLRNLEKNLLEKLPLHEAQAYHDIGGNLNVELIQVQPIARLIRRNSGDSYIDKEGRLLPVLEGQASRVLLVSFDTRIPWKESLTQDALGASLLHLLLRIDEDAFWKAQIAGIRIDPQGRLRLYPQVTRHVIMFGDPGDFERKLARIKLFYQQVLPAVGWNTYRSVDVRYQNQIVCR